MNPLCLYEKKNLLSKYSKGSSSGAARAAVRAMDETREPIKRLRHTNYKE